MAKAKMKKLPEAYYGEESVSTARLQAKLHDFIKEIRRTFPDPGGGDSSKMAQFPVPRDGKVSAGTRFVFYQKGGSVALRNRILKNAEKCIADVTDLGLGCLEVKQHKLPALASSTPKKGKGRKKK